MAVIQPIDWIIIVGYFGLILGLAWWVMRQKRRMRPK